MTKPIIAFIGAGNMASSLIGGLIANHYPPDKIWASNPALEQLELLKSLFDIQVTTNNREAIENASIVVFAVKPTVLKTVIEENKDLLKQKKPLIISVVTGIKCHTIQKWANCDELALVRSMPNTPALLRCGITGLTANTQVSEEQRAIAESILRAVGETVWFDEEHMLDCVTAISGSGPAYFFLIMEIMQDCAKQMGLSKDHAEMLTLNTALGAARMALESGKDVAILRKQVTSPGGTTEQAIKILESGQIRDLFQQALEAAHKKAAEMSKLLD